MFLTKLKSSLRLDHAGNEVLTQPAPENSFASLERRLRESQPPEARDPDLHFAIMRAVRSTDTERRDLTRPWLGRWAMATGAALCLVLCIWWFMPRPSNTLGGSTQNEAQPLMAAALDQSLELTQQAPDVALAPLVVELELLNRDVRSAVDLVVATMP